MAMCEIPECQATAGQLAVQAVSTGGTMRLVVSGELDLATSSLLLRAVAAARRGNEEQVVAVLSHLEFLDAAGVYALAEAGRLVTGAPDRIVLCEAVGAVAVLLALLPTVPVRGPRRVIRSGW
jgi:anti-anti-sigma factor